MAGEYDKSKYTKKERAKNFWYYNKLYFIFGALVILFLIVQISKVVNKQEIGFNVMFFNTISTTMTSEGMPDEGEAYVNAFAESVGIDLEQNVMETQVHMGFDINDGISEMEYATVQSMGAYVANGDLDMIVADTSAFQYVAYWEALEDLRNVFSAETITQLEPYLYYVDQTLIDQLAETQYGEEEFNVPRPDPRDPSKMEQPIPVGIYLDEANENFNENFQIANATGVMGVFINTKHPELCRAFVDYVLE